MFAVSDGYSFVTIVSILCSFFSLLFSFFNKRNLRGLIKQEEAKEANNAEEPKEAKVDHGDGATAETELTFVSWERLKDSLDAEFRNAVADAPDDSARPTTDVSQRPRRTLRKSDLDFIFKQVMRWSKDFPLDKGDGGGGGGGDAGLALGDEEDLRLRGRAVAAFRSEWWAPTLLTAAALRREWHCAAPPLLMGFADNKIAEAALSGAPPGTFVLSFAPSREHAGQLVLSFVNTRPNPLCRGRTSNVFHFLVDVIAAVNGSRATFISDVSGLMKRFSSLRKVIEGGVGSPEMNLEAFLDCPWPDARNGSIAPAAARDSGILTAPAGS